MCAHSDQSFIHILHESPFAHCNENHCVHCCVDLAWLCRRGTVQVCFLCFILSHFLTLSIIGIEVSPFTLALISPILIDIQAASLLLADGRVGVGIPNVKRVF